MAFCSHKIMKSSLQPSFSLSLITHGWTLFPMGSMADVAGNYPDSCCHLWTSFAFCFSCPTAPSEHSSESIPCISRACLSNSYWWPGISSTQSVSDVRELQVQPSCLTHRQLTHKQLQAHSSPELPLLRQRLRSPSPLPLPISLLDRPPLYSLIYHVYLDAYFAVCF